MEITVNLPPSQWYQPSPYNDLSYWGLDYPPLSAYQSWLFGKILQNIEPEAVALHSSRGYETPSSKVLMRWTAIAADLVCYLPAALACSLLSRNNNNGNNVDRYRKHKKSIIKKHSSSFSMLIATAVMLFSPCLILIDHGHFQYNSIGLGAAAGAAIAVTIGGWDHLGAVLYCVALNHKQMNLYFGPAFFAFLLGKCLHNHDNNNNNNNNNSDGKCSTTSMSYKMVSIVRLGITVLAMFAVLWSPFLLLDSCVNSTPDTTTTTSSNSSAVLMVLHRIFPVQRGLYEDYVANFWCVSSLVIKWKRLIPSQAMMVKVCAITTLIATLPSMVFQIAGGVGGGGRGAHGNTKRGLLLAMANSALAFFLFSYQVHEKSILLALLPLNMLAVESISNNSGGDDDDGMIMIEVSTWMSCIAAFSMFPLLKKDGLVIAYVAVILCYIAVIDMVVSTINDNNTVKNSISKSRMILRRLQGVSVLGCVCIHVLEAVVLPPAKYPYLWDAVIMAWSGIHFGLLFVYLYWQQWVEFYL